mgnify:CR=1 FL=1
MEERLESSLSFTAQLPIENISLGELTVMQKFTLLTSESIFGVLQIFLQDVMIRQQIIDLTVYTLITLAGPQQVHIIMVVCCAEFLSYK